MKGSIKSRFIHVISLLVVVIFGLATIMAWPNLVEKQTDKLAFLGFWITLYGLIVAIVEVARLGALSDELIKSANSAYNALKLQTELQEVKSCLEIINTSVSELKNNKAIPIIFMSRIKQVYLSVFSETSASSEHDRNILLLNSYEHITASRRPKVNSAWRYHPSLHSVIQPATQEHPYKITIDTLNRMHDELSRYSASKNGYRSEKS